MEIWCIGDSLTEGDYGIPGKRGIANVHEKNYPYFLKQITGTEVYNCGKCGFTSSSYLAYYKEGNVDLKNADIIIVMLGTNGGLDPIEDTQGNRDFYELLELFKKDAKKADIILCAPPQTTKNPKMSNCGYEEQTQKAREFVRKLSEAEKYKLIDLGACDKFTAETESVMQPNDGLHFGAVGYETMAGVIAEKLKKFYPEIF